MHASIRDFDRGDFERALREAEEAYRLYPLAQILFNIGQCHRALKHWDKAAFYYGRYLAKLPNAPNRPLVEELQAEVEYRAKAEALQQGPPQVPVVVVSPLPPPPVAVAPAPAQVAPPIVAAKKVEAPAPVPPAAVEEAPSSPAPSGPSHTGAYVLGSVAVVSVALVVIGIVYVEGFESVLGRLNNPTTYPAWQQDYATAKSQLPQAQAWQWVAGVAGVVALGTGTAAVLTW